MIQVQRCTPEEKQHMIDLIVEMREYIKDLPIINRKNMQERRRIADRMEAIRQEMKQFRRMYPLD
jgi:hypothetical protein